MTKGVETPRPRGKWPDDERDDECRDDEWPSHGGQAAPLLARFGLPEGRALLDASANLNPLGPPVWLPGWLAGRLAGLERYPDPDYAEARAAIAARERVAPSQVLLTNGGAEAIHLAVGLHAGGRMGLIEPGFGEYARACRAWGVAVDGVALPAPGFALEGEVLARLEAGLAGWDALLLCRPHNPTATLIPGPVVEALLEATAARGRTLVVDEAFIDFVGDPGESLTPLLARHPNLVLLRSLTKLYALPGLRLGYLLASAERVRRAGALQPAWSVNRLAADLVAPLLADREFLERTRAWLAAERPRMGERLAALGLEVVASRANFFLLRHPRGREATRRLLPALLRRGVLVRHTENFAGLDGGWLRVALRGAGENDRLLAALADALAGFENRLENGLESGPESEPGNRFESGGEAP